MSKALTTGRRPKLTLDTTAAPVGSPPYEIIAPAKFARTIGNIRPVRDRDLQSLAAAFEKMAATSASGELESTLGALKKLLRERAAAREKEEGEFAWFGDVTPAAESGKEVEKKVEEWMEAVDEAA